MGIQLAAAAFHQFLLLNQQECFNTDGYNYGDCQAIGSCRSKCCGD